jgi:plastocyanin
MKGRGRLFAFAVAALLLASACSSGASTKDATEPVSAASESDGVPSDKTVLLPKSYKFAPEEVEVAEGGTVTWINKDDFPHTVRLLDGDKVDKPLAVGETTEITFEQAGVYRYDCSLHPKQMSGEVIVRESSS